MPRKRICDEFTNRELQILSRLAQEGFESGIRRGKTSSYIKMIQAQERKLLHKLWNLSHEKSEIDNIREGTDAGK